MSASLKTLFDWFPVLRKLFEAKTAEEFDDFLDRHFEECVQRMESEAHHLNGDCEEKLSAVSDNKCNLINEGAGW